MQSIHVIQNTKADNFCARVLDLVYHGKKTVYVADCDISIYSIYEGFAIRNMANAMKAGKSVNTLRIQPDNNDDSRARALFSEILGTYQSNLSDAIDCAIDGTSLHVASGAGIFHPLHYKDRVKPLKSEPKKWTIIHVIRALCHGQLYDVQCRERLTDDYAWDAATNYGAGAIDPIKLAAELTNERGSTHGWWFRSEDITHKGIDAKTKKIGINLHHFLYNYGYLSIDGGQANDWRALVKTNAIEARQQVTDKQAAANDKALRLFLQTNNALKALEPLETKQSPTIGRAIDYIEFTAAESLLPGKLKIEGKKVSLCAANVVLSALVSEGENESYYCKLNLKIGYSDGQAIDTRIDVDNETTTIEAHLLNRWQFYTGAFKPKLMNQHDYDKHCGSAEKRNAYREWIDTTYFYDTHDYRPWTNASETTETNG